MRTCARSLLAAAVLLTVALATPMAADAAPAPLLRPLPDLDGQPHDLAEHRGRILVLNFWATWCVPCVEELPMLEEASRLYAERGVDIVAVSADGPGREADVRRFVTANKVGLAVRTGALTPDMQALGLGEALPATALFDRDGTVAFRLLGPLRREELTERIEWLLGDRTIAAPAATTGAAPEAAAPHADATEHPEADVQHEEGHHHDDHHHGAAGGEGGSLVPS